MARSIFNFAPGPAVLPPAVIAETREALVSLGNSGIGVLEQSHRGTAFMAVYEETVALVREVMAIPAGYDVLFLQGGASTQFFSVPLSFLEPGTTADYLITGSWSCKALDEASRLGATHVAASSEPARFTRLPEAFAFSERPVYVHFTSNETIEGVQWRDEPEIPSGAFLVCDASSDLCSRPLEVARYGIVYAGAQKNLGPAGLTLVVIRRELVERGRRDIPTMLQYRTHAASASMYNTPPTFAIFVLGRVVRWIRELGGLPALAARNETRTARLYAAIDASALFRCDIAPAARSRMNVRFGTGDPARDRSFVEFAASRGLDGLAGHRSVGGMRASLYNAFPDAGVDALIDALRDFEEEHTP